MNSSKKLYFQFSASILFLIFAFLGYCIKFYPNTDIIVNFDNSLTNLIKYNTSSGMINFFKFVTTLGNPSTISIFAGTLIIILFLRKQYLEVVYALINTIVIAAGMNQILKFLFARPRPSGNHLVEASGYSFPSGHAMGSMLFYGTLAFICFYYFRRKTLYKRLSLLLFILPIFIGISRVYLGVHYPIDIIAGWCCGLGWLLFSFPIYRQFRFKRDFQQIGKD